MKFRNVPWGVVWFLAVMLVICIAAFFIGGS